MPQILRASALQVSLRFILQKETLATAIITKRALQTWTSRAPMLVAYRPFGFGRVGTAMKQTPHRRYCTPDKSKTNTVFKNEQPKPEPSLNKPTDSKVVKQANRLKTTTADNVAAEATKTTLKAPNALAVTALVATEKPSIWQRIKGEVLHYYSGFKLLGMDLSISSKLLFRVANGESLSRRQKRQLVRTSADLFRLVPFMVFIIVPFMEILLPVALKLFPNMLPSTFDDRKRVDERKMRQLKAKLQIAKFLQDTVADMAATNKAKGPKGGLAEFSQVLTKMRAGNATMTNQEMLAFSRLFEDELTLDNLSRPQLVALLTLLNQPAYGTSSMLRFHLRIMLRKLKADDQLIIKEGVDSLTVAELQAACQERGMRSIGVPLTKMRKHLEQWLELNQKEGVPASLILLTRAMYVTGGEVTLEALRATVLYGLSDKLVCEAESIVAEMSGTKLANKAKLDLLTKEEKMIQEELAEQKTVKEMAEKARINKEKKQLEKERLKDTAPEIGDSPITAPDTIETPIMVLKERVPKEPLTAEELINNANTVTKDDKGIINPALNEIIRPEELASLAQVISKKLSSQSVLGDHKEELQELREGRSEHKQAIAEVKEHTAGGLKETRGSWLVGKKVERMIARLEKDLNK
eukprot:Ihof_evm2s779 gene=Ihof_evmTU2s779